MSSRRKLVVPTAAEILRIKASLALTRNQTRDYLDIAALAKCTDVDHAAAVLRGAEQIRAWRAQTGLTLRQFAYAAGTSASRLSDYENAKVSPTTDVLGRLGHVAKQHTTTRPRRAMRSVDPDALRADIDETLDASL
jgi:hypothetical protein